MTAAAKTGPAQLPLPTSSRPAMLLRPAARSSSSASRQEILTRAEALFPNTGGLANEAAQVVELRATELASAKHLDLVDLR